MLKWRYCLWFAWLPLVFLLAFGLDPIGVAAAGLLQDTLTATPTQSSTATLQPLFSTPTPREWDSVCPSALPYGWLTETPSGFWNAACGHCLLELTPSRTPEPTQVPSSTPTLGAGTPSATPQPSATPTITPTLQPLVLGFQGHNPSVNIPAPWPGGGVAIYYGNNWVGQLGGQYIILGVGVYTADNGGSGSRYVVPGDPSDTTYGAGLPIATNSQLFMASYTTLPAWFRSSFSQSQYDAAVTQMKNDNPGISGYSALYSYTYEQQFDFGGGVAYRVQRVGGLGRNASNIVGYAYYAYEHAPTPTPMAQVDYCGEVVGVSNDLEAFNEMLPNISSGVPSCTGVSEITIPLSLVPFFGWEDIVIPAVQVCFEPISLGSIILLGVQINLDTILFFIGGVAVLLWFLRS